MESKHRTFRRADGVVGVGYHLTYSGVLQASIAWPDRQAQRFIVDDFERNGIEEVVPLEQLPHYDGKSEPQKATDEPSDQAPAAAESEVAEVAEPLVVDGETVLEPVDKLELDAEGGATVLPAAGVDQASEQLEPEPISEAQAIRNYFADNGTGQSNKEVIAALKAQGVKVTSQQVSHVKAEFKGA